MVKQRDELAVFWGKQIADRRHIVAKLTNKAFTQQRLADQVGVTQATVSKWESGQRRPSHHHIPLISAALHTKPEALFTYPGTPVLQEAS